MEIRELCPGCGQGGVIREYNVRNWEFDRMERIYEYAICEGCGSLYRRIKSLNNEELYDSKEYGSLNSEVNEEDKSLKRRLRDAAAYLRDEYVFMDKKNPIGIILNRLFPYTGYMHIYSKQLKRGATILDVGCGVGELAHKLKSHGVNVSGLDPYLNHTIYYKNGLIVEKKSTSEIDKQYDIVFLHSVFEHLEDPEQVLCELKNAIAPAGCLGLVFPGYGKMTKIYKEHSYVIQAPQHVCLYTENAIKSLAERTGYKIERIMRESVYEWYIKSHLLKCGIDFTENMNKKTLLAKLDKLEIRRLRMIWNKERKNSGDLYHVIMRKHEGIL